MAAKGGANLGLALVLICGVQMAGADEPLSAIDWLTPSVASVATAPTPHDRAVSGAGSVGPIARNALPETVTAMSLDRPSLDAVGLLSSVKTGLPRNLWGPGRTNDILALMVNQKTEALPALQGLLLTILLAESEPPTDAGIHGRLLLGRVDKILEMGALDQAMALLLATDDLDQPELFRRMFDVALLTGAEDRACRRMTQSPGLSPALPARIFCLARTGDWETAAVTLQTAEALGQISPQEATLLTRFLDPAIAEDESATAPSLPITPLDLRMFEAIGEPLSVANLPLAFAHSDLSETTGWKARLEAAERLSRAGAISPNLLLGYYTQQKAAASGGVWERVKAFQSLEAALAGGDGERIAKALSDAVSAMESVELEVVFAELFAERLGQTEMTGPAANAVLKVQLLSTDYGKLTVDKSSQDAVLAYCLALAQGKLAGAATPNGMARAISAAWAGAELPTDAREMIDTKRTGEAILTAIQHISNGVSGQLSDVTAGLSILRAMGMEDISRRTALELMLLERRG
jgi:hypothetical protein